MKIVNINSTDTGGQCWRLSSAINKVYNGIHKSRWFLKETNYLQYPVDVLWKENNKYALWVAKFFETADVVHVHANWRRASGWFSFKERIGKIVHQHGRMGDDFKYQIPEILEKDKGAKQIRVVSTINLLAYVEFDLNRWFPTPIDMDWLSIIKRKNREPHDTIRIIHSPTMRKLKDTDLFISVMGQLQKKYDFVEMILVEGVSNVECLIKKAKCDICFDQILLQHGTSGLESMAMGQPVVAGCNYEVAGMIKEVVGYLPFIRASENDLYEVLESLILSQQERLRWGKIGYDYVKKWHSFEYTAAHAIKTYEESILL